VSQNGIALTHRSQIVLGIATLIGIVSFFWPFVISSQSLSNTSLAPVLFGVLLALVVAVVVTEISEGGIDAKAIAMLGVLSAFGILLRPLGAGTAGIETVFFVLVLAGRVFGPGFGFALGCTTIFSSALTTGGVGPWMPYQMFACAWIGLVAGLLPKCQGRREMAMLATYGALSAFAYGFLLNLSFWPFTLGTSGTLAYVRGGSVATNISHYFVFDVTTSLGWDVGRAVTNLILLLVLGPALLSIFRRAARKAAFATSVSFVPSLD
jgi:energy-coupling factor transport system substrate-specific component